MPPLGPRVVSPPHISSPFHQQQDGAETTTSPRAWGEDPAEASHPLAAGTRLSLPHSRPSPVGKGAHLLPTNEASCLKKPSPPGERGKQGEAPFSAQLNQTCVPGVIQ